MLKQLINQLLCVNDQATCLLKLPNEQVTSVLKRPGDYVLKRPGD